jgi:uncharacterized protein
LTKNDFYRYCRLLHGWLSAFAFVALCFFSFTGLLLNHPEWFSGSPASIVKEKFTLAERELQQLRASAEPSRALAGMVAKRIALKGEVAEDEAEGNLVGDEVFVRLRGVRGVSYLRADRRSGAVEVTIETPSTISMLNELHRAERAGKSWQLAVDVIAVVLIVTSLIGYLIFLSMRGARLRTAVLLTLGSTLGLCLIFVYAVS